MLIFVQGAWRVIITLLFVGSWMFYISWDDRPYMRPVAFFFAVGLSAAQALVIAGDVADRQNLREDLSASLKSNERLTVTNLRLLARTPSHGTPAVAASMGNVSVVRRDDPLGGQGDQSAERPKLDVFGLARFALTPGLASPVLHGRA